VAGGIFALYKYWTSRSGRGQVGIEQAVRLAPPRGEMHLDVLLVSLRIVNQSGILFCHESSTASLMDASRLDPSGSRVLLLPFAERDPFLPVYGGLTDNVEAARAGNLFSYKEGEPITLEPGEAVQTEIAFPLEQREGLLALLVRVQGWEKRPKTLILGRDGKLWAWSSFAYIDLDELRGRPAKRTESPWIGLLKLMTGGKR
jgi:hypothetical protein